MANFGLKNVTIIKVIVNGAILNVYYRKQYHYMSQNLPYKTDVMYRKCIRKHFCRIPLKKVRTAFPKLYLPCIIVVIYILRTSLAMSTGQPPWRARACAHVPV